MNTTNPDLAAAVERLRIAADALRFLSEIQAETMREATEALAEAKEAVGALRAPRRVVQVTGAEADGDVVALTADGELWRLHTFKDMDVWDQVDPLPEGSSVMATRAEPGLTGGD
jgi:hypothetical protein